VAPFHLIDQRNQPLTEKDLDGKIHVASFLFTVCPSVCPTLVQKLKPVQEAIRGHHDVVMVSYSVTPLTDTPKVLAEFGKARGIDPDRWRLLTGSLDEISRVIRESYFADDDRPLEGEPKSRLLHTEKVLLVDGDRRLRGIYNGTNAFEMQRLVEDIETLRHP
jgi:protein SCO1/2